MRMASHWKNIIIIGWQFNLNKQHEWGVQVQLVKTRVLAGIAWLMSRPFCGALCSERERSWDSLNLPQKRISRQSCQSHTNKPARVIHSLHLKTADPQIAKIKMNYYVYCASFYFVFPSSASVYVDLWWFVSSFPYAGWVGELREVRALVRIVWIQTVVFIWWSYCDALRCELIIKISGVCLWSDLGLEWRN